MTTNLNDDPEFTEDERAAMNRMFFLRKLAETAAENAAAGICRCNCDDLTDRVAELEEWVNRDFGTFADNVEKLLEGFKVAIRMARRDQS